MSKKLLIYGLVFGSLTASISYVYITKTVYSPSLALHLVSVLSEALFVPGIGIFLFLKSVKDANPEGFMLGKAVFLSFFLSIIIGSSVSLLFSYINQFYPKYIASLVQFKSQQFRSNPIFAQLKPEEVKQKFDEIKDAYSVSKQFVSQLFLGGARGIFLGAVIGYLLKGRVAGSRQDNQVTDSSKK